MVKAALVIFLCGLTSVHALASSDDDDGDQQAVNRCISQWKDSPFKKGEKDYKTIGTKVTVFGVGGKVEDEEKTEKPSLVLIKPSVNVLGKAKFKLHNPNGWYCFKPTTSVLGKMELEAHCKAHLATTSEGANVLGANDRERGVTVLGTIRVKTIGCESP